MSLALVVDILQFADVPPDVLLPVQGTAPLESNIVEVSAPLIPKALHDSFDRATEIVQVRVALERVEAATA